MAKRKYSDIEDRRLEEYHHPSKALRLLTPSLERVNRHYHPHYSTIVAAATTGKPKQKKNGFDVDSLLAEKTKEVEDEEERPSPTVTPNFRHHTNSHIKSAFQPLYRKKEDFHYTTKEYNDMSYKCTKSCCALLLSDEQISYGRYLNSIDLYRSKESRSTDSAGSSCNSYEHLSADYKRFLWDRRHREFVYDEDVYEAENKLRFPYEYRRRRPEGMCYQRESRHSCACADCHSNNKELYYNSRRAAVEPIKRNISVLYMRDGGFNEHNKSSTVSKKRVLIDELEKRNDRIEIEQRVLMKDVSSTTENKREKERNEDDHEKEEELDVVEDHLPVVVDNKKKTTKMKQKAEEDEGTNELLKIPTTAVSGQSRNRAVANLLERRRVAELNTAFERLRVLIPSYGNEDRALSKIKTLKYALTYMSHLMAVLHEQSSVDENGGFDKLSQQDPLFQKCREHMVVRKIF